MNGRLRVIGSLAACAFFVTSHQAGAEFLDARVELTLQAGQCVSSASGPGKAASRKGDAVFWTLTNSCGGNPKVKFSVAGVATLFQKCRTNTGATVELTAAPIEVTGTVTLACPVDYVAVLGPHPHSANTPAKSARIRVQDVAAMAAEKCRVPPTNPAEREEWLKKCLSAELELEVVP